MLWKSAGGGLVALFALSCANMGSQDQATGPDGKTKGAKEIALDNNAGKAAGIVTYPGGDRVDWKLVTLPEKKLGVLDVKLTWKPPRKGLQLGVDVFDEWGTQLAS